MWKIPPAYRIPLAVAVSLHIIIILALMIRVPVATYRSPTHAAARVKIVNAVAVNQKQVNEQIKNIKQREARKRERAMAHVRKLKAQALAAKRARMREQHRIARLKAQRRKMKQQRRLQKLKEAKKLAMQQKKLQQELLQKQLLSDQKKINQKNAAQLQGLIDEYKGKILAAIGQNWLVPDNINHKLRSLFLIQLAPGGVVLSVKLLHSSGNSALDRSAKVAILKASPLPVPKDPAIFDKFRELRLTVSPKDIVG